MFVLKSLDIDEEFVVDAMEAIEGGAE